MACSTTNTLQSNKEATSNSPNNANDSITPLVDKRADRTDLSELFGHARTVPKCITHNRMLILWLGMIGHHQALIMSSMASVNNASPSVVILTKRIINAQKDEIGIMQRWLHDRNQTVLKSPLSRGFN